MTSSVASPEQTPVAPVRRRWSLETRLMTTVLSIVSVLLILVAVVTSTVLRSALDSQLDDNVRNLAEKSGRTVTIALNSGATDATTVLSQYFPGPGQLLIMNTTSAGYTGAYVAADMSVVTLNSSDVKEAVTRAELAGGESTGPDGRMPTFNMTIEGAGTFRTTVATFQNGNVIVGLPLDQVDRPLSELLWATVLVTLGGLLVLATATVLVVRSGLRPLREVAATAERVAHLKLDQGQVAITDRVADHAVDEHTEAGRVGMALNTMLDHVDASLQSRARNEELMRRFVADASHELRTPLASIRGYSELSLRAPDNPTSTAGALERIQAQSVRMTSLVEDLLLLARLDEGQELVYGEVDLTPLAIDAVSDARAAGPDHEWGVDVAGDSVLVMGDAGRLHQIVANLLANARTHTPGGTHVTLRLRTEARDAVIDVHDDGPGIDPEVRDALFERFARGDQSRARRTGGTGLGLSIARAIADAHGGTLTVASEPGDTTFTLRVPLAPGARPPAPPSAR